MNRLLKIVRSMIIFSFVLFVLAGKPVEAKEVKIDGATSIDKAESFEIGTEYVTLLNERGVSQYYKFTTPNEAAFYYLQSYNISVPANNLITYGDLLNVVLQSEYDEYLKNKNTSSKGWKVSDYKLEPDTTYYLKIFSWGWSGSNYGGYSWPGYMKFKVSKKSDPEADTMDEAKSISRDTKYTKVIASNDDADWFKFETGDESIYELYGYNISSRTHTANNDDVLRMFVHDEYSEQKADLRLKEGKEGKLSVELSPNSTYYLRVDNYLTAGIETRLNEAGKYSFSIRKPVIEDDNISLSETKYTYNGKSQKPVVTVKHNGCTLVKDKDYKLVWSNTVDAGTASVKVTGIGSYKGTVTKTYTINPQQIYSSSVTVSSEKYIYNGSKINASVTVKNAEGDVLKKGTDYKVTYENNLNTGTAKVKVIAINNYKGDWTKSFTIHRQEIKDSKVKLNKTKFGHDGKTKSPKVVAYNNKDKKLVADTDFYVSNYGYSSVGRYKVTVNFRGNYTGSKDLYYTVVPKAPAKVNVDLRTQKSGYDDVKVSWTASEGASGYYVYYKTASGKYKYLTQRTSTTAYKDDLSDGVKYYFKVVPYYKASDGKKYTSLGSSSDYVYTLKKVNKPSVSKYSSSKVTIKWSNISGETGYEISRSTKENTKSVYKTVKSTSAKKLTFTTTKGKGYYYRVRAYKVVNNKKVYGPWSNAVYYKLK